MKSRMRRPFLISALLLTCCTPPPEPTIPKRTAGDALATRLERTVRKLSTLKSPWTEGENHEGERHVWQPAQLRAAAEWIEGEFRGMGYEVRRENYTVPVRGQPVPVWNIIVERRGKARADEWLVVGAHYDTKVGMLTPRSHGPPRPWLTGTPGANDNASGVAVLLALAREFAGRPQERSVRFVAFTNEEPPFFQTDEMGSSVHARGCRARGENVLGMISLETLGYYTDLADTQRYPFPKLSDLPTTGDFVGFVSNQGSRRFLGKAAAAYPFREPGRAEPRILAMSIPGIIPQIAWSDDWAFTREGIPALAVTDTAHQRYGCYHRACDTAEKLNYGKMAHLARGMVKVIGTLANSRD
jgi:Zn-dependent M28 family amino/carboxypeptidase